MTRVLKSLLLLKQVSMWHLETYAAGANKPTVNNHIPFIKE